MFNPFAPFDPRLLEKFRLKGVKAFVRQTYERGKSRLDENNITAYLLIHFENPAMARQYYQAIQADPGRRLFRLDDPAEYQELYSLLNKPSNSRFFTVLTSKDANEKAKKLLDKQIRAYITYKTDWQPPRSADINFNLEMAFGELYVQLKYRDREIKMKLSELENQRYVL